MQIYNTLTRKKEELKTIEDGKVKIYACGPTVYDFIHIGNARPICVFDTLRRFLEYVGYKVEYVQNFTDVDDKIIKKANEENVLPKEISERYIKEYVTDAHGLNVKDATVHPKATENMGEIIKFVKTLVDTGYAYEANGDVYFSTNKFDEYGKLSHMPLDELRVGASERVSLTDIKKDPMDFALWKASKEGEPSWKSPWGEGRPGWHIECSAMVRKHLGETIDIHCGGQDLIFPHHENEIAQSECANNANFANYWMHNGYINIDNKKMSKSLKNFFSTREVASKYGYEPIRFLMLQAHYRSQINYTVEIIEACVNALDRLYNCKELIENSVKSLPSGDILSEDKEKLLSYKKRFVDVMNDDLNTADAISVIFELVKEINVNINSKTKGYSEQAKEIFDELTSVLGLMYNKKEVEIPDNIIALVEKRKEARVNKDFGLADEIRKEIEEKGYLVEETRQGTKISKK